MCAGSAGLSRFSYLSCSSCWATVLVPSSAFTAINLHVPEADRDYTSAGLLCEHKTERLAQWWSSIALRENRSNSQRLGSLHCLLFLLFTLSSHLSFCLLLFFLFFSPPYLSLFLLLCSSAQIRLWPSQWWLRLWDLRAEVWSEKTLLGPKNQFLMPLKAVKDELIFVWCISSWTVGEFIQRGSFSCCFQICPGSLSFIFSVIQAVAS